jgi:hypothetical protein
LINTRYGRDLYTFSNHGAVPKQVTDVIIGVLKSWDLPDTDYRYVSFFKPQATLHVLAEPTKGHEAIKKLQDDMIIAKSGPVINLQHYVDEVFVLAGGSKDNKEIVFTGKLNNILKNGMEIVTDYASRLTLSADGAGGELRADNWSVFSDTSELMFTMENW